MTADVAISLWLLFFGSSAVIFMAWLGAQFVKSYRERTDAMSRGLGDLGVQAGRLAEALETVGDRNLTSAQTLADALKDAATDFAAAAPTPPTQPARQEVPQDTADSPEPVAPTAVTADSVDNPAADGNLEEALELLAKPDENYPQNLLRCCDLLRPLADGGNGEVYTALSEALFWLGDMSTDKGEQERYHGEGVEHGKKSVALCPDSVAANLWYAANMGSHGMARGIMSSLFYLGDIEKHGKKAMALDKHYFHAAPLRLMGRFYHQCPGWPIGSGDKNKAIKMLEEAVSLAPEFFLNSLYLAEVLIDKRKKSEARKVLEGLIAHSGSEIMPVYQENIRNAAHILMKKV